MISNGSKLVETRVQRGNKIVATASVARCKQHV